HRTAKTPGEIKFQDGNQIQTLQARAARQKANSCFTTSIRLARILHYRSLRNCLPCYILASLGVLAVQLLHCSSSRLFLFQGGALRGDELADALFSQAEHDLQLRAR